MKSWKNLEKTVAKILGGIRHIRVSYSESAPDVEHESLSVECKYRKSVPEYLKEMITYSEAYPCRLYRKVPKLVLEGLAQASSYDKSKIPLLAVRQHNDRLIYGFMWLNHMPVMWKMPMVVWNDEIAVFNLRNLEKYIKKTRKDLLCF